MECPLCEGSTTWHSGHKPTDEQIKNFIQTHIDLHGDADMTGGGFTLTAHVAPILSRSCEFCAQPGGEYRFGVYCCASCEVVLHKVKQ